MRSATLLVHVYGARALWLMCEETRKRHTDLSKFTVYEG